MHGEERHIFIGITSRITQEGEIRAKAGLKQVVPLALQHMILGANPAGLGHEGDEFSHQEAVHATSGNLDRSIVGEHEIDNPAVRLVHRERQVGRVEHGRIIVGVELEEQEMIDPRFQVLQVHLFLFVRHVVIGKRTDRDIEMAVDRP